MKNYSTDDEAQYTSQDWHEHDKTIARNKKSPDITKMFGLKVRRSNSTFYYRTEEKRDNDRPRIVMEYGEVIEINPKT